jgi:Flp pilus assembly protein TadG
MFVLGHVNSMKIAKRIRFAAFAAARRGATSVMFATSFIVMLMLVGLATDYSFYNEAQTQLDMAADAAAIHAVRIGVQAVLQQQTNYIAQATAAGQQWFLAQTGNVEQAKFINAPTVQVGFNSTSNLLTATVTYTGVVVTHFGGVFPSVWQNWPNWGISGTAVAVESTQSYIEFDMLLDNSSSMLIASTAAGINQMNALTPCSTAAASAGQPADGTYTWLYNATTSYGGPNNNSSTLVQGARSTTYYPYGYGYFSYTNTKGGTSYANELVPPGSPTSSTVTGECLPSFSGGTAGSATNSTNQCAYMPQMFYTSTKAGYAQCATSTGAISGGGGGSYVNSQGNVVAGTNVPQAPCAFACHWAAIPVGSTYSPDYYGVARQNGIQLRFDVLQSSAASVIQTLINYLPTSPVPTPFHIGVYTFNTGLGALYSSPLWPATGTLESLELNTALTAINNYQTPVVADSADTDFPDSMAALANTVTNAGNGSSPALARKNLFIVTDGMQDYNTSSGGRSQGPVSVAECTVLKNMGFTIYVLYTDYNPLPNYFYINNDMQYAEPTGGSPISAALQSCASSSATYYEASDSTQIAAAMANMLKVALTSPGRLSQ